MSSSDASYNAFKNSKRISSNFFILTKRTTLLAVCLMEILSKTENSYELHMITNRLISSLLFRFFMYIWMLQAFVPKDINFTK
jgi:hypothetical protein